MYGLGFVRKVGIGPDHERIERIADDVGMSRLVVVEEGRWSFCVDGLLY